MINPVQRLPRYCMLLKEFLKNVPQYHPVRTSIKQMSVPSSSFVETAVALQRSERMKQCSPFRAFCSPRGQDRRAIQNVYALMQDVVGRCDRAANDAKLWQIEERAVFGGSAADAAWGRYCDPSLTCHSVSSFEKQSVGCPS